MQIYEKGAEKLLTWAITGVTTRPPVTADPVGAGLLIDIVGMKKGCVGGGVCKDAGCSRDGAAGLPVALKSKLVSVL